MMHMQCQAKMAGFANIKQDEVASISALQETQLNLSRQLYPTSNVTAMSTVIEVQSASFRLLVLHAHHSFCKFFYFLVT